MENVYINGLRWFGYEPHALQMGLEVSSKFPIPLADLAMPADLMDKIDKEKETEATVEVLRRDGARVRVRDSRDEEFDVDIDRVFSFRQKLVANVECTDAELPLCFYENKGWLPNHEQQRAIFYLKEDAIHADMCVTIDEVYNMCDKVIHVLNERRGWGELRNPSRPRSEPT